MLSEIFARRTWGGLATAWLMLGSVTASAEVVVETVASGLDHPWCVAFASDGALLVTQRPGDLVRIGLRGPAAGKATPIQGVPAVFAKSQGGLFDILLADDFSSSGVLWLSYAHGDDQNNALRVARARLVDDRLADVSVIFEAAPLKDTPVHYGGRMSWLGDGTLLVTTGDGFDYREAAQRLDNHLGKVIRIRGDGSVPDDNPFVGQAQALPEIWTYGHRNPQGIVVDRASGVVFEHEHGPKGGDEINRLEPKANYGWPVATFGDDYSGAAISPFSSYPGMVPPLLHWTPSIAPSGMAIYDGSLFEDWQGDLLVVALAEQTLRRVNLENGEVVGQSVVVADQGRLRDVRVGPDGAIYVLTDAADGKVLRLTPAP